MNSNIQELFKVNCSKYHAKKYLLAYGNRGDSAQPAGAQANPHFFFSHTELMNTYMALGPYPRDSNH